MLPIVSSCKSMPEPEFSAKTIRSACIILNPISGRGRGARERETLSKFMNEAQSSNFKWELVETTMENGAESLARKAVQNGVDLVVAAGGDGTINQVVNGIAGTNTILGVLPLGTGNDFARAIGVEKIAVAMHTLLHGKTKRIDLGQADERLFINIAGCGFDAIVGETANNRFRQLQGTMAYVAAMIYSLATFHAASFEIITDGVLLETKVMLCSVANAQSYGGGMLITPDAKLDDGLLDVFILKAVSKFEFLKTFPKVFKGTHVTHPSVEIIRAKKVEIKSDPIMPLFIDGELVGRTPSKFNIVPDAITIQIP